MNPVVLSAEPADDFERAVALSRLAIGGNHAALATRHAQAASLLKPDSPVPSELLGFAAIAAGDADTSIASFERAVQLNTRDYFIYYTLARNIHLSGQQKLTKLIQLTPEQARKAADLFEMAINYRRTYLPAFQGLGQVLNSCLQFGPADREFLEFGLRQFPSDGDILIGLAVLDWKEGTKEQARQKLEEVLKDNPAHHNPSYARLLISSWAQSERNSEISQLLDAGFSEKALVLIDSALTGDLDLAERNRLKLQRRYVAAGNLRMKALDALNEQQWELARGLLQTLIDSDAPEKNKREARSWLDELNAKGSDVK